MARRDVSAISTAFDYGIHVPTRTLILSGAVNRSMLRSVQVARELIDGDGQVIKIILTTHGGNEYAGMGIYDCLRSFRGVVQIIGEGYVMSMGVSILQAADSPADGGGRFLRPNTTLMVHPGTQALPELHKEDAIRAIKETIRVDQRLNQVLAERMKIGITKFNNRFRFDTYFDAQQAVDEGLADEVI